MAIIIDVKSVINGLSDHDAQVISLLNEKADSFLFKFKHRLIRRWPL